MNERDRIRIQYEIPAKIRLTKIKELLADDSDEELDCLIEAVTLRAESEQLRHFQEEYFMPLPKVYSSHISIARLSNECKENFAFTKPELVEMRMRLLFDDQYSSRGYIFTGLI